MDGRTPRTSFAVRASSFVVRASARSWFVVRALARFSSHNGLKPALRTDAGKHSLTVLAALLCVFGSLNLTRAADPPAPAIEQLPAKAPAWLPGFRVRYPLRVAGDLATQTAKSVIARLPTGGWLKPDGSDVAVQTADGKVLPTAVLSHHPQGDTLIQFPRNGNDRWYWAYALNPQATPAAGARLPEGTVLELRDWAGDDLSSWAGVLAGLKKSEKVIGNALVTDVVHNCNPVRPDNPHKFVASYRGFLDLKKDGIYRFFANADDAAFLFIDNFKVNERTGTNDRAVGRIARKAAGADVQLKAGIHPFEVHHVVDKNPNALGYCTLLWIPPGQNYWTFAARDAFVRPLDAEPAGVEAAGNGQAVVFAGGVDDSLTSGGSTLFLARFEAQGTVKDPAALTWDFGDGTTGKGASVEHVYFKGGTYPVSLRSAADLPAFQRSVYIWPAPVPTSPLSLPVVVKAFAALDWKKFDPDRVIQMFEFLVASEQPDCWPLVEAVARHLLELKDLDLKLRVRLYGALMTALAEQGRGREGLKLVEPALKECGKVSALRIGIKLAAADVHGRYLKEPAEAGKLYQAIIDENRRVEHPGVRLAAIRWGDLYADGGDLVKAGEAYRLAHSLGGERNTAQTEAITRGALLRITEQKLRSGNIPQTRQLLERIELDYPEQKLEGPYRFMRAEADRLAGRYEEAVRNYEFLIKLTQWAGYRDRALFGIADSYFRMGDYRKALDWLGTVKESFPRFYEKEKLPAYQKVVEGRLARSAGGKKPAAFTGYQTGFEPAEKQSSGDAPLYTTVPALGLQGPHVRRLELTGVIPANTFVQKFPLADVTSNGTYWVEFWYRDTMMGSPLPHLLAPQVLGYLYGGTGTETNPDGGTYLAYLERTYGGWRKHAFKLRAPLAQDGRVEIALQYAAGLIDIDRLSIVPVSDRQLDSLYRFLEGTDKP